MPDEATKTDFRRMPSGAGILLASYAMSRSGAKPLTDAAMLQFTIEVGQAYDRAAEAAKSADREQLRAAIAHLHRDDGWDEGMAILLKLAGLRSPAAEIIAAAKSVSIDQLPREEGPFQAPGV
jgi:hypothetical protein